MADRYLIEGSATDGYLLEGGGGVLLLEEAGQLISGGTAVEVDIANPGTVIQPQVIAGATAVEVDIANAGTVIQPQVIAGGTAVEVDVANVGTVIQPQIIFGGTAIEVDVANVGAVLQAQLIFGGTAVEFDIANEGTVLVPQLILGETAIEIDFAVQGFVDQVIPRVVEGWQPGSTVIVYAGIELGDNAQPQDPPQFYRQDPIYKGVWHRATDTVTGELAVLDSLIANGVGQVTFVETGGELVLLGLDLDGRKRRVVLPAG